MVEHGYTVENLSNELNMSPATFWRKKSGQSDFYRKEIRTIRRLLKLTADDVDAIFFADELT